MAAVPGRSDPDRLRPDLVYEGLLAGSDERTLSGPVPNGFPAEIDVPYCGELLVLSEATEDCPDRSPER
jgi:hypothetical protein